MNDPKKLIYLKTLTQSTLLKGLLVSDYLGLKTLRKITYLKKKDLKQGCINRCSFIYAYCC